MHSSLRLRGRSRAALAAGVLAVSLMAAACGSGGDAEGVSWAPQDIALPQDAPLKPVLVNSQLGAGDARVVFGFFDPNGALAEDVTSATVRLYTLDGDEGSLQSEHELRPVTLAQDSFIHEHADGSDHEHQAVVTVFTARVDLPASETDASTPAPVDAIAGGWWGAELSGETADGDFEGLRLRFFVRDDTSEPAIGEPVPATEQAVVGDGIDIADLDTTQPPNPELHETTVAEALEGDKPLVVAFATPAYCVTRFCGPVVEQVVLPLWENYGDRVDVIHIEPYDIPQARDGRLIAVDAMTEWGLQTEPWVFVVDADGSVAAKFEGIMDYDEVAAAVDAVLAE